MLVSDANEIDSSRISLRGSKYFLNGIIFDTCVLFVYLLDKYVSIHPEKKDILKELNVTPSQISCIKTIITNFGVSNIIITPYVLAEFINRIRSEYKRGYQEIKKDCLNDLKGFCEIQVEKNDLITHDNFLELGNDISLVLATDKHLKKFNFTSVASFDGRFMKKSFNNSDNRILAFDLGTMQYFFP